MPSTGPATKSMSRVPGRGWLGCRGRAGALSGKQGLSKAALTRVMRDLLVEGKIRKGSAGKHATERHASPWSSPLLPNCSQPTHPTRTQLRPDRWDASRRSRSYAGHGLCPPQSSQEVVHEHALPSDQLSHLTGVLTLAHLISPHTHPI
jgi:hypothetical protein